MNWIDLQPLLLADAARCATLPPATCGKTNVVATFTAGSNLVSAALSLPENRHYLIGHTGSPAYNRVADIQTLQNALQAPDLGSGSGRYNGAVLFPDGKVMPVPSNATAIRVFDVTTETATTLTPLAPGNAAFCGGTLWDDNTAIFAPHNTPNAWLVNKNTGVVTVLTGYNFGGGFACAGVRKVSTGEFLFVPHNYGKFVLLNPVTMTFREAAPSIGGEAYVDCATLNDGRVYVAAHKAPCSVIFDPVANTVTNTLAPVGAVPINSGQSNFRTCKRLPDGRVALIPFNNYSKLWVYDPATNRHIQAPGTYPAGAVACATVTMFGDLMLWPWNGGAAYKVASGCGFVVEPRILIDPMFNGF